MEELFEKTCEELLFVNWSETDGEDVLEILERNISEENKKLFMDYVEKAAFNNFQRIMIETYLGKY